MTSIRWFRWACWLESSINAFGFEISRWSWPFGFSLALPIAERTCIPRLLGYPYPSSALQICGVVRMEWSVSRGIREYVNPRESRHRLMLLNFCLDVQWQLWPDNVRGLGAQVNVDTLPKLWLLWWWRISPVVIGSNNYTFIVYAFCDFNKKGLENACPTLGVDPTVSFYTKTPFFLVA